MSFFLVKYILDKGISDSTISEQQSRIKELEDIIEKNNRLERRKGELEFLKKPTPCYHSFHPNLSGYHVYKRYGCVCKNEQK